MKQSRSEGPKSAVVIHSGGMDSSICLALAMKEFGASNVVSLSFDYGQRHKSEIEQAKAICHEWQIEHQSLIVDVLQQITHNALVDPLKIENGKVPNTLVVGRNGLMARLGAIYAHLVGANIIYMGVLGLENENSGYRDCSRSYMDLMQQILRIDLDQPNFEIRTPLVAMTKKETLILADKLGVLPYLLENTVTCYAGIRNVGCTECPACLLRNKAILEFFKITHNSNACSI